MTTLQHVGEKWSFGDYTPSCMFAYICETKVHTVCMHNSLKVLVCVYGLFALLGSTVTERYYPQTLRLTAATLAGLMTLLVHSAFYGLQKADNLHVGWY